MLRPNRGRTVRWKFGLLGPLWASKGSFKVPIMAAKQRAILATLLVGNGRPVTVDELIYQLWEDALPVTPRNTLQAHIGRLRRKLGEANLIKMQPAGYYLNSDCYDLDLAMLDNLLSQAKEQRAEGALEEESAILRRALRLWRGPALCDVSAEPLRRDLVPVLEERHMQTIEDYMEVELGLGRHGDHIATLERLTTDHPYREHLWVQLMRALHATGRTAEALEAFRGVRGILQTDLGIEPGQELQDVHVQIIRSEPEIKPRQQFEMYGRLRTVSQLTPDIPDFTGRRAALTGAEYTLTSGRPSPIVVISGLPGAGKTALAVHLAHRLRHQYPDGQFQLDFRGASTEPALSSLQALRYFLQSQGVTDEQAPQDEDQQAALLRSLLVDRKVLFVFDNVECVHQIRPVLPGARDSAVIVTSRRKLSSLQAVHGAQLIALEPMSAAESHDLISAIASPSRARLEPDAVRRLAALCGHLPLALRIAATQLAAQPGKEISQYVDDLAEDPLSTLMMDGDEYASVGISFSQSYRSLAYAEQELLRTLSRASEAIISPETAAALTGHDAMQCAKLLQRLASRSLLQSKGPDSFLLHRLVRAYAAEAEVSDIVARGTCQCTGAETDLGDYQLR